jgi:hypothetical protein
MGGTPVMPHLKPIYPKTENVGCNCKKLSGILRLETHPEHAPRSYAQKTRPEVPPRKSIIKLKKTCMIKTT